jgi:hypothetical protein
MTAVRTPPYPPTDDAQARVAHEFREPLTLIFYALRAVLSGETAVDETCGVPERQAWRRRESLRIYSLACADGRK